MAFKSLADVAEVHVHDGRHVDVGALLTVAVVPAANFNMGFSYVYLEFKYKFWIV